MKRVISKRIFIYAFGFRWYNVHTDYMIEGVFWYGTDNYSGDYLRTERDYLDQKVTVGGWLRSIRDSKTFGFIVLSDGSYFQTLQVVYHDKMDNFAEISKLNVGAAVIVTGTLVATPQAKQPFEIQADTG